MAATGLYRLHTRICSLSTNETEPLPSSVMKIALFSEILSRRAVRDGDARSVRALKGNRAGE